MLECKHGAERVSEQAVADSDDAQSPAALARLYGALVFKAAWRVLGDAAQAEDVQQDVFLRLIQSPPAGVVSWPAWLSASATRAAIDALRGRQRGWRLLASWGQQQVQSADSAEAHNIEHERARQLRRALANLPRREAQCFGLRYLQGLDIAQIAQALAISENNVNVSLHRARQRLQTQLGDTPSEARP